MTAVLLAASLAVFAQSKDLALQIALDREGFSCNTIDGSWGEKSDRAFSRWFESNVAGGTPRRGEPAFRSACYREYFASGEPLFRFVRVTASDIASLARIPASASDRSKLASMGYESVKEMMAERGHLSQRALERLNPKVDWSRVNVGDVVKIPHFTSIEEYLASWPRNPSDATYFPEAALVRISLSRCEITAWDSSGGLLATFPCSIAQSKSKLPPKGALRIVTTIANPNYTYTPEGAPKNRPVRRYVWPAGPNCPVGVAWMGLDLPGYGIHGTPNPETIGRPESHGCFRLSNWNAARLYSMVKPGVKVIVEN